MLSSIVFDLCVLTFCALAVPIGMWRGALRELITASGLLLGVIAGAAWALRSDTGFAFWTEPDTGGGAFLTFVLWAVGGTVLGTVCAWVMVREAPGVFSRIIGGGIACGSALIFVTSALVAYTLLVHGDNVPAVLSRGVIGEALVRWPHLVVILIALTATTSLTVAGLAQRNLQMAVQAPTTSTVNPASWPKDRRRPLPPRLPDGDDDGKVEPSTGHAHRLQQRTATAVRRLTMPMVVRDQERRDVQSNGGSWRSSSPMSGWPSPTNHQPSGVSDDPLSGANTSGDLIDGKRIVASWLRRAAERRPNDEQSDVPESDDWGHPPDRK